MHRYIHIGIVNICMCVYIMCACHVTIPVSNGVEKMREHYTGGVSLLGWNTPRRWVTQDPASAPKVLSFQTRTWQQPNFCSECSLGCPLTL